MANIQMQKPKHKRNPNKMKAITMRIQKFSRPGVILMAIVVVIITSMVAANATQTITAPNAAFISFSLASGADSAPITPATNRSVLVMGCCTTARGAGHVSLLHSPSGGMNWAGVESFTSGAPTTTGGSSGTADTHIVYIDSAHKVDIQVASADTILVHNGSAATVVGNVTLVW